MNVRLFLLACGWIGLFGVAPVRSAPQQSLQSFQRVVKSRVAKDQAARIALVKNAFDGNKVDLSSDKQRSKHHSKYLRLATRASDVDDSNVKWLKKHVSKFGLPKPSEIGTETTDRFFLLLVHADRDREFQKKCLELMESSPAEWPDSYAQQLKLRTSFPPPLRIKLPKKEKDEESPVVSNKVDWQTLRAYLPSKKHLSFVRRVLGFGSN